MGTRQQVDPAPRRRQLGSIIIAGAIPVAACLGAGAAFADSPAGTPPVVAAENPGDAVPAEKTPAEATPADPAEVDTSADSATNPEAAPIPPVSEATRAQHPGEESEAAAATDEEQVAAEVPAPKVYVGRNSSTGMRAEPENAGLAAVDTGRLHLPNPDAVPGVAPIQAPAGKLRCGDAKVDIPAWLPAFQAGQVNEASARTEAQLARTLDSAGFAPSRSDRIAAGTLGGFATGAVVGAIAGLPPVLPGLVVGSVAGAIIGGVNAYNAPAVEPPVVDQPSVESPAAGAAAADTPAAAESPAAATEAADA
ncbi:hypothetical protein [Nocardia sp. alder85J]|uniref:hypothetical protein n=1 Tax=Nocardia sp. alder85J TaxID=2862949 RepID=UPI001CD4F656|nr:hypothetical protein [Nocardia sp. alder85J]MCX4092683.1 hypothetical protein [Nocardia sp. alder85J]